MSGDIEVWMTGRQGLPELQQREVSSRTLEAFLISGLHTNFRNLRRQYFHPRVLQITPESLFGSVIFSGQIYQ